MPEDYVHRIGRTARAGATGEAISLVNADEFKQLSDIERLLKKSLERIIIEGFDPVHSLPKSPLFTKPCMKNALKKPKSEHRDGRNSQKSKKMHKQNTKKR